jgi:nucleotide-binding universal stress UspA family protein
MCVTILVGVDGTEPSLRALAHAIGVAQHLDARLVCAYVRQAPSSRVVGFAYLGAGIAIEAAADVASSTEAQLSVVIESARKDTDLDITLRLLEGLPGPMLAGFASELKADLVVIGASRRAGVCLRRSVNRRLQRKPSRPVTTVP